MKIIMPGTSASGFKFRAEAVNDDGAAMEIIETDSPWLLIKFLVTNAFKNAEDNK